MQSTCVVWLFRRSLGPWVRQSCVGMSRGHWDAAGMRRNVQGPLGCSWQGRGAWGASELPPVSYRGCSDAAWRPGCVGTPPGRGCALAYTLGEVKLRGVHV